MKYYVAVAANHEALTQAVNTLIEDGYEPLGGLAVSEHTDRWTNERKGYEESETYSTWAQALVKR